LVSHTLTIDERVSLITEILSDRNEAEMGKHLSGDDARIFVDKVYEVRTLHDLMPRLTDFNSNLRIFVNQALDSLSPAVHRKCLRYLCKICGLYALLPRSLTIPLSYDPTDNPLHHGGLTDVWKGRHQGREVAAKVLRLYSVSDLERTRKVG